MTRLVSRMTFSFFLTILSFNVSAALLMLENVDTNILLSPDGLTCDYLHVDFVHGTSSLNPGTGLGSIFFCEESFLRVNSAEVTFPASYLQVKSIQLDITVGSAGTNNVFNVYLVNQVGNVIRQLSIELGSLPNTSTVYRFNEPVNLLSSDGTLGIAFFMEEGSNDDVFISSISGVIDYDADTDLDGLFDSIDPDDDDDNYPDSMEVSEGSDPLDASSTPLDTDGDLDPNSTDLDDDGDGFPDVDELAAGSDPLDSASLPSETIQINHRRSYDFSAKTEVFADCAGDFLFVSYSQPIFHVCDNSSHRGLVDLGVLDTPNQTTTWPGSPIYLQTVPVVVGHTYLSLAEKGEEGNVILFTVTAVTSTEVTLDYLYLPETHFGRFDTDGDKLADDDEVALGTDVNSTDTDGDGADDFVDVFPLDSNETIDSDRDGIGDNADTNSIIVLFPEEAYDFSLGVYHKGFSEVELGDFGYFPVGGIFRFGATGSGQRGLVDLGVLDEANVINDWPTDPFTHLEGVHIGHTYLSLAEVGEEGYLVAFTVLDMVGTSSISTTYTAVKLSYSYIHEDEILSRDTDDDNDGYPDVIENAEGTDPRRADSRPLDTDGDFEPDSTDADDDGDGFLDSDELAAGSDPLDPASFPIAEVIDLPNWNRGWRLAIPN